MSNERQKSPGCLAGLLRLYSSNAPAISDRRYDEEPEYSASQVRVYPYRVRDHFLSAAEQSFYQVLLTVLEGRAAVCPKVRLWDIFYVARPHEHRGAQGHIDRKHVDFLVCHPTTMQPLFGIELDDSSHQLPNRQQRDADVEAVFETAGLPLVRIPVRRSYNTQELLKQLEPHLPAVSAPQVPPRPVPPATVEVNEDGKPLCPKCGSPMVIRVASRGERKGERFYACPQYPKCRSILPLQDKAVPR